MGLGDFQRHWSRARALLGELRVFLSGLSAETVREGSWAGELFAAADVGRLTQSEAMAAISAYVIPSLDTTVLANGHLLHDLAKNPEQWSAIKRHRKLIPAAVVESVRRNSAIRWFSRVAASTYSLGDQNVPKGARVMLLYGCANRDERRYTDPDRYDITRDAGDQLAWGAGAHVCAGMHLARVEMEVMLEALCEADAELTAGPTVMGVNRGLFGHAELSYRLGSAGREPSIDVHTSNRHKRDDSA